MKSSFFFLFLIGTFVLPLSSFAQNPNEAFLPGEQQELFGEEVAEPVQQFESEEVEAKIIEIVSLTEIEGVDHAIFRAESKSGEEFLVNTRESFTEGLRYKLKEGDVVYLQVLRNLEDNSVAAAFLSDVRRGPALALIFVIFAVTILLVGWFRGLSSLVGLLVTLGVLFLFILPQILHGSDPILVTVIGSIVILGVNMHLSHGFSRSTFFAFLSTVVGLLLVCVFAKLFSGFANLSGLANEEAVLLYFNNPDVIFPQGILLAGIILGAVGVLDDVAITQSEAVHELSEANDSLSRKELFTRAMRIGRHHIASTVNTLVLAYAGVALPLLLIFLSASEVSFLRFLNEEPVAEEIVRTFAGTLALVLTVPLATLFAAFSLKRAKK